MRQSLFCPAGGVGTRLLLDLIQLSIEPEVGVLDDGIDTVARVRTFNVDRLGGSVLPNLGEDVEWFLCLPWVSRSVVVANRAV